MADIVKDIISLVYRELFTVKLLHSGYGPSRQSLVADSLTLEPDEATKRLFVNHNMGHRFFNDTLICFIRTVKAAGTEFLSPPAMEPQVPYIKFSGNALVRFRMTASTDFLAKTDVTATGAKKAYQFTNRVNAGTRGFICAHTDTEGVNNDDDLKDSGEVKADKTCFGVIDIGSEDAMNDSYRLFEAGLAQQLKSPAYSIFFKSKI